MVETKERIYTVEAYSELEKTAEIRHEFVHGKLIPSSGESKNANKIAFNCAKLLDHLLSEKKLEVFLHDESWLNYTAEKKTAGCFSFSMSKMNPYPCRLSRRNYP